MKQPSNAAHDACEALRTVNCPVGCAECSYDNDRFSARFSKMRLQERHWLPGAAHRSHRILFLLSGHIHVCMDSRDNHYLSGGQCIFLAKSRTATVMAQTESEVIALDFNNRIIFCHNDILAHVAVKSGGMESFSPVLEIVPELLSFLRGLEPAFDPHRLHIPCYHIVKEHELYLMMICLYGEKRLGCFFRDVLKPKDDFTLFVLSSYRQAKTVEDMAAMGHMSGRTFTRKFREAFHESYHKWRMKQKASEIEQAVRNGITSNEELMHIFDFSSYLAFYRFCQRHLNCTPAELRTKHISDR